jgi:hypothetical protein
MSSSLVRWKSVQGTRRQCLESIRATLVTNKPLKFDDCIVWARYARKSPPCMRVRARACVWGDWGDWNSKTLARTPTVAVAGGHGMALSFDIGVVCVSSA